MAELPVLDTERLAEIAGDDPEFAQEVLEAYLEEAVAMLSLLDDGDDPKVIAHRLKGASANVGAMQVWQLCVDLETEPDRQATIIPRLQAAIAAIKP